MSSSTIILPQAALTLQAIRHFKADEPRIDALNRSSASPGPAHADDALAEVVFEDTPEHSRAVVSFNSTCS